MPDRHMPAGTPIGRRLLLPPSLFAEDLPAAVRAVDQVHGDGELPELPIVLDSGLEARGRFVFRNDGPSAIVIRAAARHRGFALVHEIGHLVDLAVFGDGERFGSTLGRAMLAPWHVACEASRGVGELRLRVDELLDALPPEADERRERLLRALAPEEFWARGYAQFVAVRSGDAELRAGLDASRALRPDRVYYPYQWSNEDFALIGDAIDGIFRRLGWRVSMTR